MESGQPDGKDSHPVASRKPIRQERNPLTDDLRPTPAMSDYAEDVFDEARKREEKRQYVRPLNISTIFPDPAQPRRTLPSDVRRRWNGRAETLPEAFDLWLQLAEAERRGAIDLRGYVMAERDSTEDLELTLGPMEYSLLSLADLAANVRRNGLMNSITVVRLDGGYRIETGERRWLAHHLLSTVTGDDRWQFISARVVEATDVWRQAGENSTRADLNAISKARQFALLLMDLYREKEGPERDSFSRFDELVPEDGCDRPYYAQVANSERYRIPSGKGEQMLNAMGLKGRAAFSRYRAFLQLPDDVWQWGDDLNWSDDRLYLLATLDPATALERAQQMKRRDDGRRTQTNVLTQNSPDVGVKQMSMQNNLDTDDFRKRSLRVARMVDRLSDLNPTKRSKGLEEITVIRRWLDEVERTLRDTTG